MLAYFYNNLDFIDELSDLNLSVDDTKMRDQIL